MFVTNKKKKKADLKLIVLPLIMSCKQLFPTTLIFSKLHSVNYLIDTEFSRFRDVLQGEGEKKIT